jgi:hypothetical protein
MSDDDKNDTLPPTDLSKELKKTSNLTIICMVLAAFCLICRIILFLIPTH